MRIEEEGNHSRIGLSRVRERERERERGGLSDVESERAMEIGAVGENRREKAIGLMSK